jgi:hypothetical protein
MKTPLGRDIAVAFGIALSIAIEAGEGQQAPPKVPPPDSKDDQDKILRAQAPPRRPPTLEPDGMDSQYRQNQAPEKSPPPTSIDSSLRRGKAKGTALTPTPRSRNKKKSRKTGPYDQAPPRTPPPTSGDPRS